MKIRVNIVEPETQRYETSGDYFYNRKGYLIFRISKQKTRFLEKMQLIHELIEQTLCEYSAILHERIDEFDMNYDMKNSTYQEPGDDPNAPYHKQHVLAKDVEKMICKQLNLNFDEYFNSIQ